MPVAQRREVRRVRAEDRRVQRGLLGARRTGSRRPGRAAGDTCRARSARAPGIALAEIVVAPLHERQVGAELALVLVLQKLLRGEQVGVAAPARQRHRDVALADAGRRLDQRARGARAGSSSVSSSASASSARSRTCSGRGVKPAGKCARRSRAPALDDSRVVRRRGIMDAWRTDARAPNSSSPPAASSSTRTGRVLLIRARDLRSQPVWTLPKGALTARRVERRRRPARGAGGDRLPLRARARADAPVTYWFRRDGRRIRKTVRWYLMRPLEKVGEHDHEVDEVAVGRSRRGPDAAALRLRSTAGGYRRRGPAAALAAQLGQERLPQRPRAEARVRVEVPAVARIDEASCPRPRPARAALEIGEAGRCGWPRRSLGKGRRSRGIGAKPSITGGKSGCSTSGGTTSSAPCTGSARSRARGRPPGSRGCAPRARRASRPRASRASSVSTHSAQIG